MHSQAFASDMICTSLLSSSLRLTPCMHQCLLHTGPDEAASERQEMKLPEVPKYEVPAMTGTYVKDASTPKSGAGTPAGELLPLPFTRGQARLKSHR